MVSVSDLNKECDRLLELADSVDRIDVYSKVKAIKQLRDRMNKDFNAEQFDEVLVTSTKITLNRKLLELEEILSMFDVELKKRRDERTKIYILDKWYNDRLTNAIMTKDSKELLEFCYNMAHVGRCKLIVSDIVYSCDDISFSFLPECEAYCNIT